MYTLEGERVEGINPTILLEEEPEVISHKVSRTQENINALSQCHCKNNSSNDHNKKRNKVMGSSRWGL